MTPPLNKAQQDRFPDALVLEIKAELGRRGWSSRELGRQIGRTSQYVSMRLDGGNPKTGELVALTVEDVAAIASALDLDPHALIQRAEALAASESAIELPRAARRRVDKLRMGDD